MSPTPKYRLLLLLIANFALLISTTTEVSALSWGGTQPKPSESECRPYIEKALKEQLGESPTEAAEENLVESVPTEPSTEDTSTETASQEGSIETTEEPKLTESVETVTEEQHEESVEEETTQSTEDHKEEANEEDIQSDQPIAETESVEISAEEGGEQISDEATESIEETIESTEAPTESEETEKTPEESDAAESIEQEIVEEKSGEEEIPPETTESQETVESVEEQQATDSEETTEVPETHESKEETVESAEVSEQIESQEIPEETVVESTEADDSIEQTVATSQEQQSDEQQSGEQAAAEESKETGEEEGSGETVIESEQTESHEEQATTEESIEEEEERVKRETSQEVSDEEETKSIETSEPDEVQKEEESKEEAKSDETEEKDKEIVAEHEEVESTEKESVEEDTSQQESAETVDQATSEVDETETSTEVQPEPTPEEDLTLDVIIPEKLRSRDHLAEILRLGPDAAETEQLLSKTIDITLRELKRLYDNAIKPLEMLYKYRDLSNRHFGDPEIFSKPLILFMGPWSGGKSSIINYLLDNEYKKTALRTGAEPSPAYFNIVMWGEEPEVLDGTQLAADWTFSGLQKFGQGLLDRLRGLKLKQPLLEKVNIVEIPGILEIRKQVERMFPFNDACQWFIDRADIIFLVYDPAKLDVGPETEAILDQLKGREYQTRIILNKADQVKPEELMRVQGTLIWNISPLMSSPEPPLIYSTSLWSIPYEQGAPTRLLYAQELAFLRDLREAVDKRVENKIASARRFAVRVRNHAKMVDCYLTTFYNHKSFFGNKKRIAEDIIEHPQNYHIYEGLSTLTNISRYDLPDPEVYRDFFRLNAVYEFQQLSSTCTYFRGCPINRLDIAIAYDLPELVGKYKKSAEQVLNSAVAQKAKS